MMVSSLQDFEDKNARQWDQESMVSDTTSVPDTTNQNQPGSSASTSTAPQNVGPATAVSPTYPGHTPNWRPGPPPGFPAQAIESYPLVNSSFAASGPLAMTVNGQHQLKVNIQKSPVQYKNSSIQGHGCEAKSSRDEKDASSGYESYESSGSSVLIHTTPRKYGAPNNAQTPGNRSEGQSFVNPNKARFPGRPSSQHSSQARKMKPRATWAEAPGLITTRRAVDIKDKAQKEQETRKYLGRPDPNQEYPFSGYYAWPYVEEKPADIFGLRLEELDPVRQAQEVHIEDTGLRELKITTHGHNFPEERIVAAIKGIRHSLRHSKAKLVSASAKYVLVIPTASVMHTVVQPRVSGKKFAAHFELCGEKFTETQMQQWRQARPQKEAARLKLFEEHLKSKLRILAPMKSLMRMRIYFGHVVLTHYRDAFAKGEYGFEEFDKMMDNIRISSTFDRKLRDACTAKQLQKRIISWRELFESAKPRQGLQDARYDHTLVIFGSIGQERPLRIEARIEDLHEAESMQEYQLGTIHVYEDNSRNKLMELITIDVERQLDWNLEVITDNSVANVPDALIKLVEESVTTRTATTVDTLGEEYPAVRLGSVPYGLSVTGVVMRSVVQYKMKASDYIVEISIYRSWQGKYTTLPPKMAASVCVFRKSWDMEMESIEKTVKTRSWDKNLENFFGVKPLLDGEISSQKSGLEDFIDEVQTIQGLLADVLIKTKKDMVSLEEYTSVTENESAK